MEAEVPIKLAYIGKTYLIEDLRPAYEEFKRLNPVLFSRWKEYALSSRIGEKEFPLKVDQAIIEFLRQRFDYDSELDLISGFGDFSKLLYRELHLDDKKDS